MSVENQSMPDLEDLAAYVDGFLGADRQRAVEQRLVRDDGYYRDYLETLRFLDEEARGSKSVRFRRLMRRSPTLGVAAALLAVLVTWRLLIPAADPRLFDGLEAAAVVVTADWNSPGWTSARDVHGIPPGVTRWQKAFRLGVRTADLEIALLAEDPVYSAASARRSAFLCEALELAQRRDYERLAEEAEDPKSRLNIARSVSGSLSASLAALGVQGEPIQVGRWLQACRYSALTFDAESLRRLIAVVPATGDLLAGELPLRQLQEAVDEVGGGEEKAFRKVMKILDALARDLGG